MIITSCYAELFDTWVGFHNFSRIPIFSGTAPEDLIMMWKADDWSYDDARLEFLYGDWPASPRTKGRILLIGLYAIDEHNQSWRLCYDHPNADNTENAPEVGG